MSLVHISPSAPAVHHDSVRLAASKGHAEHLKALLACKTVSAQLGYYLEDVNPSDGCTALLTAVKKGNFEIAEMLAKAGACMTSPVLGQSALHILLGSMTVDEQMLDMLLSHGANPYMPDKSGRTAMEYALQIRGSKDGLYREADTMGNCVLKFVKAQNAFHGNVYILSKMHGVSSWLKAKLIWKERWSVLVPKYNIYGKAVHTQLMIFSKDRVRLKGTLFVTEAQVSKEPFPGAVGNSPGACVALHMPWASIVKRDGCFTIGTDQAGYSFFISMPDSQQDSKGQPMLSRLVKMMSQPAADLFSKPVGSKATTPVQPPVTPANPPPQPLRRPQTPPQTAPTNAPGPMPAPVDPTNLPQQPPRGPQTPPNPVSSGAHSHMQPTPDPAEAPPHQPGVPGQSPGGDSQTLPGTGPPDNSPLAQLDGKPSGVPQTVLIPNDSICNQRTASDLQGQGVLKPQPESASWQQGCLRQNAVAGVPLFQGQGFLSSQPGNAPQGQGYLGQDAGAGILPLPSAPPATEAMMADARKLIPDDEYGGAQRSMLAKSADDSSASLDMPTNFAPTLPEGLFPAALPQQGLHQTALSRIHSPDSSDTPSATASGGLLQPALPQSGPLQAALPQPAPVLVDRSICFSLSVHQLCLQHDWDHLTEQCTNLGVVISKDVQDGNVTLHGTESDIDQAMHVLETACEEEERNSPEASLALEPYQAALFTHPELQHVGEHMIQEVKKKHRVVCWVTKGPAFNHMHLEVEIGNLTEQNVSGIVNPTNNQLNLTGGVSKHIATAVGPELKVACKEYLEALPAGHRRVPVGTAVVSPIREPLSSPMPFDNIIHAVGPHYSGDEHEDIALLKSTVQAVLQQATNEGMQSIAMPLIGAGAAGWPIQLAAQVHIASVLQFASSRSDKTLKEVRFVDINKSSIEALQEELRLQSKGCSLAFVGRPADCKAAMQDVQQQIEAQLMCQTVKMQRLSAQQQSELLQHEKLALVLPDLSADLLTLKGCRHLVYEAASYVREYICDVVTAQLAGELMSVTRALPSNWAPMSHNTELFEVNLAEPDAAELVAAVQKAGAQVVKVHRIQNQLLWKVYAGNLDAMRARWRHEPALSLVNGGFNTLWHGTSQADPWAIYAAEHGFQHNHARADGPALWGHGTYFSTRPQLCMDYSHRVSQSDEGVLNGFHPLGSFSSTDGLRQMLAVDVLTGKAKNLAQDKTLRMPPLIEDKSLGRQLGIADLRYDSVSGVHPSHKTPIYITYNSGHAYPRYLVTYKTKT